MVRIRFREVLLGIIIGLGFLLLPSSMAKKTEVEATTKATEETVAEEIEVTQKNVDDMLIASIRFVGDVSLIPSRFDKLFATAESYINGKPLVLFYPSYELGDDDDVEVCVPVSDTVETDEVKTRLLSGGEFLTTLYYGSHEGEAGEKAWNDLFAYVNNNNLRIISPSREVYLEWDRKKPENNVTELQYLLAK